jgi:exportin-2 (importin alpha re-exporter)
MVSAPPSIQAQLGEAISTIADSDFWQQWDTLVDDLVSRLTADNYVVNIGVLQVAHSIFSRWRPLFRSDELYTEVNHVLGRFAAPYLAMLQSLDSHIETEKINPNKTVLLQQMHQLDLAVQLFYDLSCQDLPPQFEDAMQPLADLLLNYLRFDNSVLRADDENTPGPLENVKAGIFEILTLYVQKYYDAFEPHVSRFVENSWELLTTVGLEPKNDLLVSKALNFLTSTTANVDQAQPFNDNGVLAQVVENVIVPNLSLRESDLEMFEDEPIEFIRRDLEGSDSETRRRAATDFLRKLMEQFETPVTAVVSAYVQQYLTVYSEDPDTNWRSKDTAIYLFCSIAAKGTATAARGIVQTNNLVDVGEFFSNNVAGDLTESSIQPLLKVDAIKYLHVFRSIISKALWQQAMPRLVARLGDSNYVVYTYAAIAVERVLYLADEHGKQLIDPAHIKPLSKDLLEHLFSLIEKDVAPEKIQENEFLMRCVMRVLIVIKEDVQAIAAMVSQHLVSIINIVHHNPSNPRFYYYLFESIGALIRCVAVCW